MTPAPRIAMWMLKHFGSGPDNDTLLGDLAEQYQRNGNAMWYWRQALKAIPVNLFKEIRRHKWIAGRALLTGWAVWMIFSLGPNTYSSVAMIPLHVPLAFFFSHRYIGDLVINATLLPLLVGMLCGWLVALLHRKQGTAAVLLFATSFILLHLLLLWKIVFNFHQLLNVSTGGIPSVYAQFAAQVGAAFLGILLGGGLLGDKPIAITN